MAKMPRCQETCPETGSQTLVSILATALAMVGSVQRIGSQTGSGLSHVPSKHNLTTQVFQNTYKTAKLRQSFMFCYVLVLLLGFSRADMCAQGSVRE